MKIIVWNCKGTGNKDFKRHFLDMTNFHKPDIVFLLETKVSDSRAETISFQLGFSNCYRAPSIGREGGVWMLWNDHNVQVNVLGATHQSVHALIQQPGEEEWIISGIYASPLLRRREELWNALESFGDSHDRPWLLLGDFNDILYPSEKCGGKVANWSRCEKFQTNLDRCNLIDLGASGPRFTWSGVVHGGYIVRERLDRAVANESWTLCFPDHYVRVLPRLHSDHCPIMVNTIGLGGTITNKPFRFEIAWDMNPTCKALVENEWNKEVNVLANLERLPQKLQHWNREVFGNIFVHKKTLRARIEGIQKIPIGKLHDHLRTLERELVEEYNTTLRQEEALWFQKSRVK